MLHEALNTIVRAGTRRPLWAPSAAAREVHFGREEIERLVPHRSPFMFVDKITGIDLQTSRLRGERFIEKTDPVFRGHFPGHPVYPGVLLLETIGQFGLCLLHFTKKQTFEILADQRPRDFRAIRVHYSAFLSEVGPEQQLEVTASLIGQDDYTAICAGQVMKDDTICAFAVMEVYLVEN